MEYFLERSAVNALVIQLRREDLELTYHCLNGKDPSRKCCNKALPKGRRSIFLI